MIRKSRIPLVAIMTGLALASAATTGTGWAHGGATGVVKERMESMKSMGDAMKGLAAMVKGQAELDDKALADYAAAIKTGAARIPDLFPKGTNAAPSEALPKIWVEWDKFKDMAEQLEKDADLLANADATDARSVKIGFAKIGKSCKDCHTEYRKKKAK